MSHYLKNIVDFVGNFIKKVRWNDKRILRELGQRSVFKIREDGTTHFAGSC